MFSFPLFPVALRRDANPPLQLFRVNASISCRNAALSAKIGRKQLNRGVGEAFLGGGRGGAHHRTDGFFRSIDSFLFSSFLDSNALAEEAIAATLDLKCCLEAETLRDDGKDEGR